MGAALSLLVFFAGTSAFCLLHQIKNKIQDQIHLDQQGGRIVIQLRASLVTMDESRKRLRIAKAALIAGCIDIVACPALTRAYRLQEKIEKRIQGFAQAHWRSQKVFCLSCSIPEMEEFYAHPDLTVKLKSGSLFSSSRLWKKGGSHAWSIAWVE